MMIKDGGGSIRIEVGTNGLGNIDMAINVQDQKLDLRIIASSEQVRDILIKEIPKLRDELITQNVSLDSVEVGVSGGGSHQQNYSQDGQYSEQRYQREYSTLINMNRSERNENQNSPDIQTPIPAKYRNQTNHKGSIAIMA